MRKLVGLRVGPVRLADIPLFNRRSIFRCIDEKRDFVSKEMNIHFYVILMLENLVKHFMVNLNNIQEFIEVKGFV